MDYREVILSKAKSKQSIKRKVVVFDLDGTITSESTYPELGEPHKKVVEKMRWLRDNGYEIIISSCRWSKRMHTLTEAAKKREHAQAWLEEHEIPYDQLWEDDKPYGIIYVDDHALNVDDIDDFEPFLKKIEKS